MFHMDASWYRQKERYFVTNNYCAKIDAYRSLQELREKKLIAVLVVVQLFFLGGYIYNIICILTWEFVIISRDFAIQQSFYI